MPPQPLLPGYPLWSPPPRKYSQHTSHSHTSHYLLSCWSHRLDCLVPEHSMIYYKDTQLKICYCRSNVTLCRNIWTGDLKVTLHWLLHGQSPFKICFLIKSEVRRKGGRSVEGMVVTAQLCYYGWLVKDIFLTGSECTSSFVCDWTYQVHPSPAEGSDEVNLKLDFRDTL